MSTLLIAATIIALAFNCWAQAFVGIKPTAIESSQFQITYIVENDLNPSELQKQYCTELTFEPSTNWTGQIFQARELGYVVTNHVLTVEYQDTTNRFTLKTVPSDKAVWREIISGQMLTNNWNVVPWNSVPWPTNITTAIPVGSRSGIIKFFTKHSPKYENRQLSIRNRPDGLPQN